MIVVFLFAVAMLVVGIALVLRVRDGVSVILRLLSRPTLTVAQLHEGPVEISGKVKAAGDALLSLSGHHCIALTRTVSGTSGTGKYATSRGTTTSRKVVPARLTDATGDCRVDLDLSDVVGERWKTEVSGGQLMLLPAELVPSGSDRVTIEEVIVPEDAVVLVSGDAKEVALPPESYRGGLASEWILSGTADQLLLLSVGGQTSLIARTAVVTMFVLLVGTSLTGMGVLMMLLAFN